MDLMKLQKDFPFATPEHIKELLKACPYAKKQHVAYYVIACGLSRLNSARSGLSKIPKSLLYNEILQLLDSFILRINKIRENEELNGKEHVRAGPLLHVHSVHLKPKKAFKKQQLSVYGKIRVSYQHIESGEPMQLDVYNRSAKDADIISSSGCYLSLGLPVNLWTKLKGTTILVDLHLKIGAKVVRFAKEVILVGETTEGNFEELISKEFHRKACSATLTYIAMPFAALCQVHVRFRGKDIGRVVNVSGKIVARYKRTYGNYNSEPCILFDKQKDFEPVAMNEELSLQRTWLGLPAYSSLELDLDLRDFDTNRKIRRTVELLDGDDIYSGRYAVDVGDFAIILTAGLFEYPLNDLDEHAGLSDPDKYKGGFESSSSNTGNPWCRDQGQSSIPIPSHVAEFYSIFIGSKKMTALNILGRVEFSSGYKPHYLFQSSGSDSVEVQYPQKVLPLEDACMSFDKYDTLELKVNLRDVGGNFANRGFATYKLEPPIPTSPFNTQICSVFPGNDGFCALHYSLFSRACQANIEIIFKIKSFRSGVERIYGSAIAQYSNFDYSTEFKRDYFRSVLFRRTEKDPAELKNGEVPLSRNVVAVPMDSSLIVEVDFCGESLKDHLFCKELFMIGRCYSKTETNDYELEIKLTWDGGLHNGQNKMGVDKGYGIGGVNQTKTSIKRKQTDQSNGGSDLEKDKECRMGGVNRTNTCQEITT